MINTITPIIKSPPPTNSPKVATTLPGSPVPRINFVEETFNAILKIVVNKSMVGKKDISNTSFANIQVNKIVKETAILNANKTSNKAAGMVIISIAIETCIQCPLGKCAIDAETEIRPDWCPLKPMLEKAEVSDCDELCDTDDWYDSGYADGYNACIDEILGDKE